MMELFILGLVIGAVAANGKKVLKAAKSAGQAIVKECQIVEEEEIKKAQGEE